MNFGWQEILVAGLVLAAIAYLARRFRETFSRRGTAGSGCASACGQCPAAHQEGRPLVSLETPSKGASAPNEL
jgi:hypothetical protein